MRLYRPVPCATNTLSALFVATLFCMLYLAEAFAANQPASTKGVTTQEVPVEKPWGIDVVAVRSTAAGHMLEFRYRVTDSEKAAALFERKTKPLLIHSSSGKVLGVPSTAKLGPLRNSNMPRQGRTYWMFFGNAGHLVKAGDKVTVAIGDYQSKEISVE